MSSAGALWVIIRLIMSSVVDFMAAVLRGETSAWPDSFAGDEARLLDLAQQHGVIALLAHRLGSTGVIDRWPPAIGAAMIRAARESMLVEEVVRLEVERILDVLTRAGVNPLLFKGTALAYAHYAAPWLRPRLDTDLLIPETQRATARLAMEEAGYRTPTFITGTLVRHQFHYTRVDRTGVPHTYHFHWKVSNRHAFANLLSIEELERYAVPVLKLCPAARTLDSIRALLVACIHRVAHHWDRERLIWCCDVHLLMNAMEERQLDEFVRIASSKGLGPLCAAEIVRAKDWFKTPVSDAVLDRLTRGGGSESARLFLCGGLRPVDLLLSDLRALPTWLARLRLLREQLFPPADYMLSTHDTSTRALLPALYVHRLATGVWRWFKRHRSS